MTEKDESQKTEEVLLVPKTIEIEITSDGRMDLPNTAKFLKLQTNTLYGWILSGKAPTHFKIGKTVFFYYEDVVEWIKLQYNQQTQNKV